MKKEELQSKLSGYAELAKGLKAVSKKASTASNSLLLMAALPSVGVFLASTNPLTANTLTGVVTGTEGTFKKGNFNSAVLADSNPGTKVFHYVNIDGNQFKFGIDPDFMDMSLAPLNGGKVQVATGYIAVLGVSANINANNGGFPTFTYSGSSGPWAGSSPVTGIVGFEFSSGHEGWIKLTIEGSNANGPNQKITLHEFAFVSNAGNDIKAGEPQLILPVELVSFSVRSLSDEVKLHWQTATETNNAGFEVERSEDGKNFRSLAWVEGHGTTLEQQEYLFDDKDLRAGRTYYYRLKQVDFDGTFEYSKIISVTLKGGQDVVGEFYPNPAKEFANVNINTEKGGIWTAQIFDATGKAVRNEQRNLDDGKTEWQLDLSTLAQGLYFVKFGNGKEQHYRKLKVDNF